jgi:hypothetical protein
MLVHSQSNCGTASLLDKEYRKIQNESMINASALKYLFSFEMIVETQKFHLV